MANTYNIYCDESSVEGDGRHPYMVIGAFFLPRENRDEFLQKFLEITNKTNFNELKWSKISKANEATILKLIDLFFNTEYANFSCIVVDKQKINFEVYHNNDHELAFYKFYYLLLKSKLRSGCGYYIYLDKKPVSVQSRVSVLKYFLTGFIKSERQDCVIKHLQEYSSIENRLIQIADLFTGAVASKYNFTEAAKSETKKNVISHIESKRGKSLQAASSYTESKFNVFKWRPMK